MSNLSSKKYLDYEGLTYFKQQNDSHYLQRLPFWTTSTIATVSTLDSGITFAYADYHDSITNGTIAAFSSQTGSYQFQIQTNYSGNSMYWRSYNGDNGTWSAWEEVCSIYYFNHHLPSDYLSYTSTHSNSGINYLIGKSTVSQNQNTYYNSSIYFSGNALHAGVLYEGSTQLSGKYEKRLWFDNNDGIMIGSSNYSVAYSSSTTTWTITNNTKWDEIKDTALSIVSSLSEQINYLINVRGIFQIGSRNTEIDLHPIRRYGITSENGVEQILLEGTYISSDYPTNSEFKRLWIDFNSKTINIYGVNWASSANILYSLSLRCIYKYWG